MIVHMHLCNEQDRHMVSQLKPVPSMQILQHESLKME